MRGGWFSFESRYISKLPIPTAKDEQISSISAVVTQILTLKRYDPMADTSALEAEVDGLVYVLYGLTEEAVGIL